MTNRQAAPRAQRRRLLHGRRRGRPLRVGQRGLIDSLLPRLLVSLPAAGELGTDESEPRTPPNSQPVLNPQAFLDPRSLFDPPPGAIWLEIGFGGGEHLAAQAAAHPEIGFIGCEVFENGIVKLLSEVARASLTNIRLLTDDARLLLAVLPDASISRVFILFPDPWPKLRHHKRRIVSAETLQALARVMTDGAELRLATDDPGYLDWMLERVTDHPDFVGLDEGPADWRQRRPDWPVTRYETKAIAAGREPHFLRLARRPRQASGSASG